MKKLSGKNAMIFIIISSVVYFSSYLTRINYGAVINEIMPALDVSKKAAGAVSTAAFLTYGIGQIFSGLLGDKFKPRNLIFIGLIATSVCNIGMMLMKNIVVMTILWGFNGFIQALFWPPLVRMMVENLTDSDYSRACVYVSMGSSCGTIFIYLTAPLFVTIADWRLVFAVSAAIAVIVSAVWMISTKKVGADTEAKAEKKAGTVGEAKANASVSKIVISSGMILIAIGIILQGILRDGLTTWMPTFISETFDLPSALSILSGVILPLFSTVSFTIASVMQNKIKNELLTSVVLFGLGTAASLIMLLVFGKSAIVSMILMALITACMHGVNLMLISRVPHKYARFGHVSTISGVLNAFTYVGSAASSYGFAAISESYGWYFTIVSWAVIAAAGGIFCLFNVRRWKKFCAEGEEEKTA